MKETGMKETGMSLARLTALLMITASLAGCAAFPLERSNWQDWLSPPSACSQRRQWTFHLGKALSGARRQHLSTSGRGHGGWHDHR